MKDLEILTLLLQATKRGTLKWNKTDFDHYRVSNVETLISVRFFYPLLAGDTTSEPDVAKVSVSRVTLTFFNGTEGMHLVRQILSEGFPDWSIHMSNIENALDEAIESIKKLTSKSTEP